MKPRHACKSTIAKFACGLEAAALYRYGAHTVCIYGAHLKQACQFGVPEGHMGGVGVGPGIDAHPQGGQGQVDALGL